MIACVLDKETKDLILRRFVNLLEGIVFNLCWYSCFVFQMYTEFNFIILDIFFLKWLMQEKKQEIEMNTHHYPTM